MGGVLAGSAEAVQEVKQVVGVLAGGVEADEEVRRPVLPGDLLEALPEQRITGCGLGELEFVRSGLEVVLEEDGVVAIATGAALTAFQGSRLSRQPRLLSLVGQHPSRFEALDPTVTELLPNDTQPPTDTDHQVLPSLGDPNNIRRTNSGSHSR
jgi:hypothetical protein